MKDDRMKDALEAIARRGVPENTNLWPNISARVERKSLMQTIRAKPLLIVLIVILILLLLTGVVYAIGNVMRYIPGIGLVNQSAPIRVLAEQVSVTQEGIIVTIEQVVADLKRTVIIYKTEGLTIAAANSKGEGGGNPFGSEHLLRLPDGSTLKETSDIGYGGTPEPLINNVHTESGWPNYVARLVYPPVSSQMNDLTLVIPVLLNMPVGAAPENWSLTFHLKPAPPNMTLVPIIELNQQSTSAITITPAIGETSTPSPSDVAVKNGFTFKLNNVVELNDGFVFTGNLSWDSSAFSNAGGAITLTDASGRKIPMEEVQVDSHEPGPFYANNAPWSYRTNRKAFAGPVTFSISSITTNVTAQPIDVGIDFGSNPQIGQTWSVNKDFVVEGHTIRLLSVGLSAAPENCQGVGIDFEFKGDIPEIFASVEDVVPQQPMVCSSSGGGGGGGPTDPTLFSGGAANKDIPVGLHHYSISFSVPEVVNGPWQVIWNPPLTSEQTPTAEPAACLTVDKWKSILTRNDAIPFGVNGKILIEANLWVFTPRPDPFPNFPLLQISNLDGSNRRDLVYGGSTGLSPDGTCLLYTDEKGYHLLKLVTGQDMPLGIDGDAAIWSPDGTRILYSTSSALYVMQSDGSDYAED